VRLKPRSDATRGEQLARSAEVTDGADEAAAWLAGRREACRAKVRPVLFAELDGWSFSPDTGDLRHRSGRFFSVEGLHVTTPEAEWEQPIIVQPEVGILGILATELDGVLHFLMQAKMEPGNPGLVQLSPTVQATRSNYTKAHGGTSVKYLEHFLRPEPSMVLADVLQSEHGAWFYRKRNRNMIVETSADVVAEPDFRWLTLGELGALLRRDNVVNMDARTVLASAPSAAGGSPALLTDLELLSWFTGERARAEVSIRRMPLDQVTGWQRDEWSVHRTDGRFFRIVGVSVAGADREVLSWTQPLLEPVGTGIAAFAYREFGGVPHVLVRARIEGGFLDVLELGPTVQCVPANYGTAGPPRFLDLMLDPPADRVRYSAVHSEEGGRFKDAESRYLIVDTDEASVPSVAPDGYQWVTPGQLSWLAGHSRYVNVQARSLLAVLNSGLV
jgi:oxidase EvaA